MALVVKDRIQESSTTTGTGTLTLGGALTGFQSFSSAIGNGNTTYYAITLNGEWEVGIGTVGSGTLTRDNVLESSNSGSLVNFSAGTKNVFCTYPAEKSLYLDASGNSIALGTPASATLTNATGLPISTGISGLGTNVATFLATPSSANFASALTDETGSGKVVFDTSPTLSSATLNGNTTFDTNTLYVDSSNDRVGIGNTSPSDKLDVTGNVSSAGNFKTNRATATNYYDGGGIQFQVDGTIYSAIAQPTAQELSIYTGNSTSERARINSSGDFLIGRSSISNVTSNKSIVYGQGGAIINIVSQINNGATLDINPSGDNWMGILMVSCAAFNNYGVMSKKIYAAMGSGTTGTFTQIGSQDTGGGRTFSVSLPSSNTIRVTNSSGAAAQTVITFYGSNAA